MKQKLKEIKDIVKDSNKKGFFHLISANLLIQIFAFLSQLFVAGLLSVEDIGRIKVIQTLLAIFSIFAGMGLNVSTLKLCSENNRTENEKKNLFRAALKFNLISGIIIYFLVVILGHFKLFSPDERLNSLLPLALPALITNPIFMLFVAYTQASKNIKLLSALTSFNRLASIAAIILLTWLFNLEGYWIAYNLSLASMAIFSLLYFRREYRPESKQIGNLRMHSPHAKPSVLANIFSESSAYMDILIISMLVTDQKELGYYSFAVTLTIMLRVIPMSIQQISAPYFSGLSDRRTIFIQNFRKYNKLLILIVISSFILVELFVPDIISWVFRGKYDQSMIYFKILAIGWSIRQLMHIQSAAIFGAGKIKYNTYVSIISAISNLIIYYFALKYWGLIGLSYATILSGLIIYFSSYLFFRKIVHSDERELS